MFDIKYKGLRIEVTLAATRELLQENLDLNDVVDILEKGYDCATGKRKPGIIEKCVRKQNKITKVVIAKTSVRFPDGFQENVWRLIHLGTFTYSKKHKR